MTINKSQKNKRNSCFPRTSSLANAEQIIIDNVNDNTDDFFLLINKKYWTACALQTKQQLDILFLISQSAHLVFISSCSGFN
jgi:hypothetical protein